MRCISPSRSYSLRLFGGGVSTAIDQRGKVREIEDEPLMIARFSDSGLTEWEIDEALSAFSFSGLPDGVSPLARVGVFDSEAYVEASNEFDDWSAEDKAKLLERIDARLEKLSTRYPSEFIIVVKPATEKPWESYDEDDVEEILALQARIQRKPEAVRLYEAENKNRPEIITAMEILEFGPKDAEPEGFIVQA